MWLNPLGYRPIQYAYSASNESGATGTNQNGSAGPLACSGSTYLKLFPNEHCAPLSECKKVDSGPMQGTYECPGESSLIVPPELLCPDHSFKGINGTCEGTSIPPPEPKPPIEEKCPTKNPVQSTSLTSSSTSKFDAISYSRNSIIDYQNQHNPGQITNIAEDKKIGPTKEMGPLVFDKPPWKFTYEVLNKQGLVLKDITAGDQIHFTSLSVPHFEMRYSLPNFIAKIIRFDLSCDTSSPLSGPKEGPPGVFTIPWDFKRTFNETDLQGTLSINYEIVVVSKPTKCEFVGKTLGFIPKSFGYSDVGNCFRIIPKVTFNWSGDKPHDLDGFSAFYKLDYGQVGIALDKNSDNFIGNTWDNTGRLEIQTKESKFYGTSHGMAGQFDNIHTAHPGQTVFVPGCRFTDPIIGYIGTFDPFDCNHIHWRWAGTGVMTSDPDSYFNWGITPNVDVMVEPSTDAPIPESERGTPYLVPRQTIQIAIVKVNANEEDPDDPLSSQIVNGEEIAKAKPCLVPKSITATIVSLTGMPVMRQLPRSPDSCQLVSAEPVRIWYEASITGNNSATFFRHGSYVVDPKGEFQVKPMLEHLGSNIESVVGIVEKTAAPDKNILKQILQHLKEALDKKNWLEDGSLPLPEAGRSTVFPSLSKVVELFQNLRQLNGDGQTSQWVDKARSIVLMSAHFMLLNTMNKAVQTIRDHGLNISPDSKSKIENLLAENDDLKNSMVSYVAAISEPDLTKSPEILTNLANSWNDTLKGMNSVMLSSGIPVPQDISLNLNPNATSVLSPTTTGSSANANNTGTKAFDLSGIWSADDRGTYYLRQIGNTVWWLGMSDGDGGAFTNIFKGEIKDANDSKKIIEGYWADVPKGATAGLGILSLSIEFNSTDGSTYLAKRSQTGGFGASVWTIREGASMGPNALPSPMNSSSEAEGLNGTGGTPVSNLESLPSASNSSPLEAGNENRSRPVTSSNNQASSSTQSFNIADETAKIKSNEYRFYSFVINPGISGGKLIGSYKEKGGNDVLLNIYDASSCLGPPSSAEFDITKCTIIHTEAHPSGEVQLPLSPGKYYLTLSSSDQIHDLKVNLRFDLGVGEEH